MRTSFLTILLLLLSFAVFCQSAIHEKQNTRWGQGYVVLTDGTTLNGFIRYNNQEDHIAYDDGENSKVFSSRNFLQVSFFDEACERQRVFISVAQPESEQYVIFEVLKEYSKFALLSRIESGHSTVLSSTTQMIMSTPITRNAYAPETSLQETIFIMDGNGSIHPYLKVTQKKDAMLSFSKNKEKRSNGKILNERLLAEYVSVPVYEKLQVYADNNHLKFNSKSDFMKVLEYYDTLRN
jgi:hypothetical protein